MKVIDSTKGKTKLEVKLSQYSNVEFEDKGNGEMTIYCHSSIFDYRVTKMSRKEFIKKSIEAIRLIEDHLDGVAPIVQKKDKRWWEFWK